MIVPLRLALALLLVPAAAHADPTFVLDTGVLVAIPDERANPLAGWAMRVGVGGALGPQHLVGGRLAVGVLPRSSSASQSTVGLSGFYRFMFSPTAFVRPFVGAAVGIALWNGCVFADNCGGLGPVFAAETGALLMVTEGVALSLNLEVAVQTGIANTDYMITPACSVGVVF